MYVKLLSYVRCGESVVGAIYGILFSLPQYNLNWIHMSWYYSWIDYSWWLNGHAKNNGFQWKFSSLRINACVAKTTLNLFAICTYVHYVVCLSVFYIKFPFDFEVLNSNLREHKEPQTNIPWNL